MVGLAGELGDTSAQLMSAVGLRTAAKHRELPNQCLGRGLLRVVRQIPGGTAEVTWQVQYPCSLGHDATCPACGPCARLE